MNDTRNDFDALKIACATFSRYVGPLEKELAKNGEGNQNLVSAYKDCAAQAARDVAEFRGQAFLSIYGNQPNELISAVLSKCAKLGINL